MFVSALCVQGIPADKRNKVFAKYEKIKSTMNPTGHGIGLSLCQELVHKMHGTIRIDPNYPSSPFGKGTRIEMIFPFEQVELDTATYENKEEHVDLPESIRVLICDDNKVSHQGQCNSRSIGANRQYSGGRS